MFITNPNNPTGYALTKEQVESFMDGVPATCVVVFGEAYVDFLPAQLQFDSIELVRRLPNMMVTRTFSKAYGLAGLRAGYGIAQPAMIEMMNRIRPTLNINLLAQASASACSATAGSATGALSAAILNARKPGARRLTADSIDGVTLRIR